MSDRPAVRSRRERGAAAVEMALILPLLLLIMGGIIDFGRFFYTQNIVVNAAREGARSRALGYDIPTATDRINQSLIGVQGSMVTVTRNFWLVQGPGPTLTPGVPGGVGDCPATPGPLDRQRVTVTVPDFKYIVLGPVSKLFGSGVATPSPNGTAEMRCGG